MTPRLPWLAAITLVIVLCTGAARAQPTITGLNKETLPRSGRVAISGSGFGTDGQVVVGDLPAWVSTWTETRIVAYVPEESPLGATTVRVEVSGQPSNEVPLTEGAAGLS